MFTYVQLGSNQLGCGLLKFRDVSQRHWRRDNVICWMQWQILLQFDQISLFGLSCDADSIHAVNQKLVSGWRTSSRSSLEVQKSVK